MYSLASRLRLSKIYNDSAVNKAQVFDKNPGLVLNSTAIPTQGDLYLMTSINLKLTHRIKDKSHMPPSPLRCRNSRAFSKEEEVVFPRDTRQASN